MFKVFNRSLKLLWVLPSLHVTHRSFPSRKRACFYYFFIIWFLDFFLIFFIFFYSLKKFLFFSIFWKKFYFFYFVDFVTTPTTTQRNTTSTQLLGWTRKWLCKPHHHQPTHRNSIAASASLTTTFSDYN